MRKTDDAILEHWGVKGMRWGIRKDRSSSTRSAAKKEASLLSDKELRDRVNRLIMEKQYADLVGGKSKPSVMERGAKEVGTVLGNAAKNSLQNYAQQQFTNLIPVAVDVARRQVGR